jgi:hypothetical protein
MKIGLYFCTCGEIFVSDFPFHIVRCMSCSTDLTIEENPTMAQLNKLEDKQLEHLWKLFSKVTFDESDESITERFLIWLPTTNRFVIWLWFSKRYSGTFANLPGKIELRDRGQEKDQECECGNPIKASSPSYINRKHGKVLCDSCGKREMIDLWLLEGYRNPWIRCADDPLFTRSSFKFCETIDELMNNFKKGNWCLGDSFVYRNLAFLNQLESGDEWLTIKDWCAFESITFKSVLKHGDEYASEYIQKLVNHYLDSESGPNYTLVEALI